jgi:alpha-D-xyloside xylohydrolase
MIHFRKKSLIVVVALISACILNGQSSLKWQEVYPGIWKASAGKQEDITLLKSALTKANQASLLELPIASFPLPEEKINVLVSDGKIILRFPLQREEQLFGLGLNFKTVNQRGRILNLHVDHYGGVDNGRTHAPVPFYVSSDGYGVLVDAARYITVYAGTTVRVDSDDPPVLYDRNTDKNWDAQPYSDAVEILVPAAGVEIYVFAGPTPMNVVQRYNLLCGGGCLPPKWGLGFTQRVHTLSSHDDIMREVKEYEDHNFPLDFIGLEPGWHSMAYPCTFEWDSTRFPEPEKFLGELSSKGIYTNLWFNPYVSPKASIYLALKKLSGTHTVWNGLVPDITLPEVRELYKSHFIESHINVGVGAYKIDEVDGYDFWVWPDVATFPSGTSAEQMRQIYGLVWQQMTTSWFREKNRRTWGLVRASNAGASSFPYVIYNDYYSHRDFITALINSSFIGVLWVPEVRSSHNAEEWVRRMQSVCFSPMAMLDAWTDKTKPWTFPEVEQAVREVANLRMQILPYLYTAFAQYHYKGLPPFRAMNLVEGFAFRSDTAQGTLDTTFKPYALDIKQGIKDQFMVGDNLLVAPMFEGQKSRKVFLPEGRWYDFYTGDLVGENEMIEVSHGLDKIPLFVKDGGIIPLMPVHKNALDADKKLKLEIRHYGTGDGLYSLYDDDGITFDYEKGEYSFTEFSVTRNKQGRLKGRMEKIEAGKTFSYDTEVSWKFMSEKTK